MNADRASSMARRNAALHSAIISLMVFVGSLIIYPLYTEGDQHHYRMFYDTVRDLHLADVLDHQRLALSSAEPVYGYLAYYGSRYISKDVLFSGANALLAFFASRLLFGWRANAAVVYFLVVFNFYSLVLYFAAERLKVAVLLLIIALGARGALKAFSAVLSPMAHSQVLALYASIGANRLFNALFDRSPGRPGARKLELVAGFCIGAGLLAVLFTQGDHIRAKWESHAEFDTLGQVKSLVFLGAALWIAPKRVAAAATMLPLLILVFFLGGDRLNMFAFYIFVYYSIMKNSGLNVLTAALLAYYAFTGFLFVDDIVAYGSGFP